MLRWNMAFFFTFFSILFLWQSRQFSENKRTGDDNDFDNGDRNGNDDGDDKGDWSEFAFW